MAMRRNSSRTTWRKKKFDYRKKNYKNPFFQNRTRLRRRERKILNKITWKIKLIIAIIIILFFGIIWFFCFSNFFNIDKIEINGLSKISAEDIEKSAWEQADKKLFLIISQKNIFFFSANELIKKLEDQYCFDKLIIKKNFPRALTIDLKEKTYSAIWFENDKYYFIDSGGDVISEVNPLDITEKKYPLISFEGEGDFSNEKIKENESNISYIVQLFNELKKIKIDLKIDRFIIDKEKNSVKVSLILGPKIFFNTQNDINKQISKLVVIINEKLKDDFNKKTYIDLRYGDRVYYK